jgi:hypothetical protein
MNTIGFFYLFYKRWVRPPPTRTFSSFFLSSLTTIEPKNNNQKNEDADVYFCVCMKQDAQKSIKLFFFFLLSTSSYKIQWSRE